MGANDGASGVAILLEIARMLKAKPAAVPVWIVLFDGEDYGPGVDRMFLGAKHFAANLPAGVPRVGVLLDMVGDKNLEIFKEIHSVQRASAVVNSVWETAQSLGYRAQFNPAPKYAIQDDHLPLLDRGIAMIDVIDFDYPPWHTLGDTVDKCSAASLDVVGEVVASWTYGRR
jgi:Zn-dependent M28 family amino/carboxypeptidase